MASSKVGFKADMGNTLMSDGLGHEIHMDEPSQVVLHKEMLNSSAMQTQDVKFNLDMIDFGFTEYNRISESRGLTLNNKFDFPVRV
jgi:hypothetical protein